MRQLTQAATPRQPSPKNLGRTSLEKQLNATLGNKKQRQQENSGVDILIVGLDQ
jgi:hypothetical protein